MRLLFITNNMPPLVDGVGDYTFNLAREFARHGHDVAVVCRNDSRIKADYDDIKVFPVVRRWNKSAFKPIAGLIRQRQIEVVSLQYVPHGFHPKGLPFGLVGLVGRIRRTGVKLFTFCHEVSVSPEKGNFKRTVLSILMSGITRNIVMRSDFLATSIVHYKDVIGKLMGDDKPIWVIPIPSNVPEQDVSVLELEALRREMAQNGEFIVGFMGNRNVDNSLRAIRALLQDGEKIKILVIGQTRVPHNCGMDESMYWTGVLPLSGLCKFLKVADCIVLPEQVCSGCSFKSGSLMAALRAGKPVVTGKGFMTDGRLVDKENICFVDGRFSDGYKKCLDLLASDENLRVHIGQNARRLVENVNWEQTYNRYIQIMHRN